jgi:hypothetical protein
VTLQGTASDTLSGLYTVSVNGHTVTSMDGFAHWNVTVPLTAGANSLVATATDSAQPGGNVTNSTALSVTLVTSTQNDGIPDTWKSAHGLDPNSVSTDNSAAGDPDHDGVPNILEYAFNTDPQTFNLIPGSTSVQINPSDSLPYLQLIYSRRIGVLDLTYTVEVSDDLINWSSPSGSVTQLNVAPNGDGITESVTVRINYPLNSTPQKFAHVKVTSP